jgi:hypothetical protein
MLTDAAGYVQQEDAGRRWAKYQQSLGYCACVHLSEGRSCRGSSRFKLYHCEQQKTSVPGELEARRRSGTNKRRCTSLRALLVHDTIAALSACNPEDRWRAARINRRTRKRGSDMGETRRSSQTCIEYYLSAGFRSQSRNLHTKILLSDRLY